MSALLRPCMPQMRHNRPAAIKGVTSAGSRQARRRKPLGVMMGCVLKLNRYGQLQWPKTEAARCAEPNGFGDGLPGRIVLSGWRVRDLAATFSLLGGQA